QATPATPRERSSTSHPPAAGRHAAALGAVTGAGQVVLVPVQDCAGSHTSPEPAQQTAAALPAGCWQASLSPSHASSEQGLPSSVHSVPAACFPSVGQAASEPVQNSAASHSSTIGRHSVVAGLKALAGQSSLLPSQVAAMSQAP